MVTYRAGLHDYSEIELPENSNGRVIVVPQALSNLSLTFVTTSPGKSCVSPEDLWISVQNVSFNDLKYRNELLSVTIKPSRVLRRSIWGWSWTERCCKALSRNRHPDCSMPRHSNWWRSPSVRWTSKSLRGCSEFSGGPSIFLFLCFVCWAKCRSLQRSSKIPVVQVNATHLISRATCSYEGSRFFWFLAMGPWEKLKRALNAERRFSCTFGIAWLLFETLYLKHYINGWNVIDIK